MERKELIELAETDIWTDVPQEQLSKALKTTPFVAIPNALNLRDIGLAAPSNVKPGLLFRSGTLHSWPESSRALLASQLGIKTVFDFRSERERTRQPSPDIDGIETLWIPPTAPPSALMLDKFIDRGGAQGYTDMYIEVATIHAPAYTALMRHLADRPGDAILFHCSAGKDRTGVLAAVLMKLAGVEDEVIAEDYIITRVGIEPQRDMLTEILRAFYGGLPIDTPGFKGLCSVKAEFMREFLVKLEEKWGGAEGYVEKELGLSKEEIEKVKTNISK